MHIVAISPHADDVELGLGAYISRLKRLIPPARVEIAVMSYGSASKAKSGDVGGETRKAEARAAADFLGAELTFLDAAEDGCFNVPPHSELVARLEDYLFDRETQPDELFIPLPSFHLDHSITHKACISALRPRMSRVIPKRVFAYEYPGHHWGPQVPSAGKSYRVVDELDMARKIGALRRYGTQWVSDDSAPGLGADAVRSLAKLRGSEVAADYAELFYLIREID